MPTLPPAVVTRGQSAPFVLTSTDLCRVYSPGRGLGSSLLIHGILLAAVQLLAVVQSPIERSRPRPGAGSGNGREVRLVMYLPPMGGGGGQGKDGGSESSGDEPAASPSSGTEGLVHPGPHVIRSDSPLPDNSFQTLLQPGHEDLPVAKEPLNLPNFLSMPEVPDTVKSREEPPAFEEVAEEAAEPEQRPLKDLPISGQRVDVPDLPSKPAAPVPVKSEEAQFVEPPGVAAEPKQRALEDLPFLSPRPEVPDLPLTPEVGFVPPSGPADQAVGLPDTVKPEEPEPLDLSEGLPVEPFPEELEDLPFLKQRSDAPEFPSMAELPDPVEIAEPPPVAPPEDVATQPFPEELEDLPFLKQRSDAPEFPSMAELPDPVEIAEPPPVAPSDVMAELKDLPVFKLRLDLPRADLSNILSLTTTPSLAELPEEIPAGEARGRFTVSPEPSVDTSEAEPGAPFTVVPGDETSVLTGENDLSTSVVNITFGAGKSANGEGSASGGGEDAAPGSGAGSGPGDGIGSGPGLGTGSGPGKGPFEGITIVGGVGETETSGSGTGTDLDGGPLAGITIVGGFGGSGTSGSSGSGTGAGSDGGSLAGITIVGGLDGTVTPSKPLADIRIPQPHPDSYGQLSVVSTESSGGGLPYFGVFSDEQIRTVYLDMRQGETDESPLWTLEFGVPGNTAVQKNPAREVDEGQEGAEGQQKDERQPGNQGQPESGSQQEFVLPFPLVKASPALPLELLAGHVGKMVVVYAVINVEGKMEQMVVKESPDDLLNRPVLEALSKWVFRPGLLDDAPVAVGSLLGIPLWLPVPAG